MKHFFILFLGISSLTFLEVKGFCYRPYDHKDWEPHSIEQRSIDADIIVYAEVINSPCIKPKPLTNAPAPTTAAAILEKIGLSNLTRNESFSSNFTSSPFPTTIPSTTPLPTTVQTTLSAPNTSLPSTSSPPMAKNCSFGSYNASLRIHCVIKGGSMPEYINLAGLGFGNDTCFFRDLNETEHDFHAYDGQNYTIFLKRKHDIAKEDSFSLHTINIQPATKEIENVTMLRPIFKVAGRHAHAAIGVWVNKTDPVCKPYSGSTSFRLFSFTTGISMSLVTMAAYFLY